MPREGGLFGQGGVGRQVVEAAAKRTLGVDIAQEGALREKLVEAVGDLRLADRLNRRLGYAFLNAQSANTQGQDELTQNRLAIADRVRSVARVDSHLLYAVRLRNAFCFGKGVTKPKATDEEIQALLDDFWSSPLNQAELTSSDAQWRAGKDLWEVCNVYHVVFADGMDGRVLLGGLQHDQVRDVVRDPQVWRRILYYVVSEFIYEYDYNLGAPRPNPRQRTVYYASFEGMRELREEVEQQGRTPPPPPPADKLKPGEVLHVAINRGREQAFGEPEMRTSLKWASAFSDLLAGQVEKAKAAQRYLMKVKATGVGNEQQLTDVAMRAVGRRSPLSTSFEDVLGDDPDRRGQPRAGAEFWGNEALDAQPLNLDAGSASARQDMESASQAFAAGTNYPGHYFFGDPGSLAGASAVELPVMALGEIDQEVWKTAMRKLCDLRIERAIKVGLLSERREPTQDEIEQGGVEVGPDGLVDRDMTYQLDMPEQLRRNLPELMQLVVDTATTFDPNGSSEPLQRALLGHVLGDMLEFPDTPALVERIFAQATQIGGGDPASSGDPTATGPDGKQHSTANPYGVKQKSEPVVEAVRLLWARLQDPDDELAQELQARFAADANGVGI